MKISGITKAESAPNIEQTSAARRSRAGAAHTAGSDRLSYTPKQISQFLISNRESLLAHLAGKTA